jgi:hypothetical protein
MNETKEVGTKLNRRKNNVTEEYFVPAYHKVFKKD